MAISFVTGQFAVTTSPTTGTTIVAAFPNGIAAGSVIAVALYFDPAATTVTITTDKGDTAVDCGLGNVSNTNIGILACVQGFLSPTTASKTITATFNNTVGYADMSIWEIAGLTAAVFDKHVATNDSVNTSPKSSASTGTLSAANEAAIGFAIADNTFTAATGSWVQDSLDANGALQAHQVVSSNAAIALTATCNTTQSQMWCVTLMSGAAPTTNFGWYKRLDESRQLPVSRLPDQGSQWFVRSPNPVPTTALPRTGENRERVLPPVRRPDEPFPWFVRSPNPVPITWLPTAGETEHPFPIKRAPAEPPGPFFIRPPNPVPTIFWSPPISDRDKLPPVKENPDPAKQWFIQSPNPVPTTWLPTTGKDVERLPPFKLSTYQFPYFIQSPNPVPTTWLPTSGKDTDRLIRIPVQYYVTWQPKSPSAAVGIAGMAWYISKEEKRPSLPIDQYALVWDPAQAPLQTFMAQTSADENPSPRRLPGDGVPGWSPQAPTTPASTIAGMAWWRPAVDVRFPIVRSPDEARPFFVRSPNPVPITWLPSTGKDLERLAPIGTISDRYVVTWSANIPPPIVPISGMAWYISKEEMRPPKPPLNPDEFKPWFVRSPNPVPTTWLPLTGEDVEHPLPVKLRSYRSPFFVPSPVPVPTTWLPLTGEDVEHPLPVKLRSYRSPFFVPSPVPVPTTWLPLTGKDLERLPAVGTISDRYGFTWSPRTITPPVAISGMAWYVPSEQIPRAYPGNTNQRWGTTWAPQVIVTVTIPLRLRTLMGTGL